MNKIKKECTLVMLPCNEKSIRPLLINPSIGRNGEMELAKHEHDYPAMQYKNAGYKTMHLYVLSDDKIGKDDWYTSIDATDHKKLHLDRCVSEEHAEILNGTDCRKVIGTTDRLNTHPNTTDSYRSGNCVERLSDTFVNEFINAYNSGRLIEKVLVEYSEGMWSTFDGQRGTESSKNFWTSHPIVNSVDSTITVFSKPINLLKPDINLNRNRHYGKRIGDVVQVRLGKSCILLEVVGFEAGDNNRLFARNEYGDVMRFTAEECDVVQKVEERKNDYHGI